MSDIHTAEEWKRNAEKNASLQLELEAVDKDGASQAAMDILKEHADLATRLQEQFILSNRDMLSTSLVMNRNLSGDVKKQILLLRLKLQDIIWSVASTIESRKYDPYTRELSDLDLTSYQRKMALDLVNAEKNVNISLQAVKTSIDFFAKINNGIINEIQESQAHGDSRSETKFSLMNAVLVFELANFTIEFLEKFQLKGIEEISHIHSDMIKQIKENKGEIRKLKSDVALLDENFKKKRLLALDERNQSLEEIEKEWDNYWKKIQEISKSIGSVSSLLPKLKFTRDDAKNQINVIGLAIVTRIVGDNLEAIDILVNKFEDIDLVPLPPTTIRRLFGGSR